MCIALDRVMIIPHDTNAGENTLKTFYFCGYVIIVGYPDLSKFPPFFNFFGVKWVKFLTFNI